MMGCRRRIFNKMGILFCALAFLQSCVIKWRPEIHENHCTIHNEKLTKTLVGALGGGPGREWMYYNDSTHNYSKFQEENPFTKKYPRGVCFPVLFVDRIKYCKTCQQALKDTYED